jgi:hypothetical protein
MLIAYFSTWRNFSISKLQCIFAGISTFARKTVRIAKYGSLFIPFKPYPSKTGEHAFIWSILLDIVLTVYAAACFRNL